VEVVSKACCVFVESLLLISTSEEINTRASASCSTKTNRDSTTSSSSWKRWTDPRVGSSTPGGAAGEAAA
jgi:hypothetical protein